MSDIPLGYIYNVKKLKTDLYLDEFKVWLYRKDHLIDKLGVLINLFEVCFN